MESDTKGYEDKHNVDPGTEHGLGLSPDGRFRPSVLPFLRHACQLSICLVFLPRHELPYLALSGLAIVVLWDCRAFGGAALFFLRIIKQDSGGRDIGIVAILVELFLVIARLI